MTGRCVQMNLQYAKGTSEVHAICSARMAGGLRSPGTLRSFKLSSVPMVLESDPGLQGWMENKNSVSQKKIAVLEFVSILHWNKTKTFQKYS